MPSLLVAVFEDKLCISTFSKHFVTNNSMNKQVINYKLCIPYACMQHTDIDTTAYHTGYL